MGNGRLVRKHAEEERNLAQDKLRYLRMEDNLAKEKQRKEKHVTRICAQSTVNGDLMANGRLARKHVEMERNLAQD